MDRLTSMALFVAAAEDGSLAAAARRFGLSASMAGKHVAAMEDDLNVRLMQRSTRKLVLTSAGQNYYDRCKRLLEDYEEARREASEAQAVVRGVLRIAAPLTFGEMHLSAVVGRFMARYPDVSVEMMLSDRYVDLLSENVDVAIRIGQLRDSGLVARRLAPCRMILCAAPAFLAQHGVPETIEDLRHAPRLVFSDAVSVGDWSVEAPDGTRHVIDGPVRLRANTMRLLLSAAIDGAGITFGPRFVFDEPIADGRLVPLMPELATKDLSIHAVYPTKRHVSLRLRAFLDHVVSAFAGKDLW